MSFKISNTDHSKIYMILDTDSNLCCVCGGDGGGGGGNGGEGGKFIGWA